MSRLWRWIGRLCAWLDAFPGWGEAKAEPGPVPLVQECARGFGYHGSAEMDQAVGEAAVRLTHVVDRMLVGKPEPGSAYYLPSQPVVESVPAEDRQPRTTEQIREDRKAATDRAIEEVREKVGGEEVPTNDYAAHRQKIDPRIVESARQDELPPHAKNLKQPKSKLPPGRGKRNGNAPMPDTAAHARWRGRYCTECGKHSGGPRSTKCMHCFEPFKAGK